MKGYIYIASAFGTVNRSPCGQAGSSIDNDPHFWTSPPTWGICRNDLRAGANVGDFVFFVLPRHGRHPQMIFAYLRIAEKITHVEAFARPSLLLKRMGDKVPNGNIIVDSTGGYNKLDYDKHLYKFDKIKNHYAVGDETASRMLTSKEIQALAPQFVSTLSSIVGVSGSRAIDIISRKGRILTARQVRLLLRWLRRQILSTTGTAANGAWHIKPPHRACGRDTLPRRARRPSACRLPDRF
ncbi:MAG: hypothetical protein BWY57_00808 [Betaproteobacteria bacterium ADurb.Bin341]|nr:MAG: hypothetical protein BWY57_00808 [Betaproteobacteria bacterium ADurb.Bin341]